MKQWTFVYLAAPWVIGCGGGPTSVQLRPPRLFQELAGLEIAAQVVIEQEKDGQTGKTVVDEPLILEDGRYAGHFKLAEGDYLLRVDFTATAPGQAKIYPLAGFDDHPFHIDRGGFTEIELDENELIYQDFDDDGDGIANLDELRFEFRIDEMDIDQGRDRHAVAVTSTGISATIGTDESDAPASEKPAHPVNLGSYWMDRLEVSIERYRVCVARQECPLPRGEQPEEFLDRAREKRLPVTAVSIEGAREFCAFAGGRLPTEEEWEYAARHHGGRFPWGDTLLSDADLCLWVNGRKRASPYDRCNAGAFAEALLLTVDGLKIAIDGTSSTDSIPNFDDACSSPPAGGPGEGICQLAGNVWEWTDSRFAPYPGETWEQPAEELWVIRGGSADSMNDALRSTFRYGVRSDFAGTEWLSRYTGFRCAYDN